MTIKAVLFDLGGTLLDFNWEHPAEIYHKVLFSLGISRSFDEAKILQDADRLDIIGAIGLARVFTRGGWVNQPIHDPAIPPKDKYDGRSLTSVNHIYEKILKVKATLHTKTAKEIAEERHRFVEHFLERLLNEWNAEI